VVLAEKVRRDYSQTYHKQNSLDNVYNANCIAGFMLLLNSVATFFKTFILNDGFHVKLTQKGFNSGGRQTKLFRYYFQNFTQRHRTRHETLMIKC